MSEDNIQDSQELESQSDEQSSFKENVSEIEDIEPSEFEDSITNQEKRSLADELDIQREDTRSKLATILISILVGTYFLSFVTMLIVLFVPVDKNKEKAERYTY